MWNIPCRLGALSQTLKPYISLYIFESNTTGAVTATQLKPNGYLAMQTVMI